MTDTTITAAPAPPIPLEDFFKDPVRGGAKLSPDGTRIAYLAPSGGRMNVWVRSVGEDNGIQVTHDTRRGIYQFRWAHDPRWLLYMQDTDGNEDWHLYRVDLDDPEGDAVELTPMDPGSRVMGFDLPRELPGKVIVQMNWPRPLHVDVHLLDLATGEISLLAENPGDVLQWIPTRSGELFVLTEREDHDFELAAWDIAAGERRTFARLAGEDFPYGVIPIVATPDGTGVWIGAYCGGDNLRLVRVDAGTGEETVLDEKPGHDLDVGRGMLGLPTLLTDPRSGELLGAFYVDDQQILHAIDPQFAEVCERLSTLADGAIGSVACDDGGRRWIASFLSDVDPGVTYLYDHTTGQSEFLHRPYPHLDPASLAPMQPVTVTSRDGLRLPCHLTLPIGVEPNGLPLLLVIHGGPWFRDSWGYNRDVQFLANRGYAVLQVNFRGSIGYGKAFMQAAMGQFAGTMHDDLIDAVNWAIEQGYADPERVGIYGGSYGGYAALVAATFTPDVFACAVDYCGISDLANFQRTLPPFLRAMTYNNWGRYVGDPDIPEQEADMLARSPITRIDDLKIPLMVVQGANDARVVQAESDNIVEGLRERGIEVEYMVKDDEGHGFTNQENVMEMFQVMEKFLEQHLR